MNLIINNRAGGNAPLIAEKITEMVYSEKQFKRTFSLSGISWDNTSSIGYLI